MLLSCLNSHRKILKTLNPLILKISFQLSPSCSICALLRDICLCTVLEKIVRLDGSFSFPWKAALMIFCSYLMQDMVVNFQKFQATSGQLADLQESDLADVCPSPFPPGPFLLRTNAPKTREVISLINMMQVIFLLLLTSSFLSKENMTFL